MAAAASYRFNNPDPYDDFFGLGPTLTDSDTPVIYAGKLNEAMALGGYQGSGATSEAFATDDIFSIRPVGEVAEGRDWSFTGWFWFVSMAGMPGYLSNWANGGPVQWLFWDDGTDMVFQIRDAAAADHVCNLSRPSLDAWHFVAVTYDASTGTLSLSVDDGTPDTAVTPSVAEGTGVCIFGGRNASPFLNGAMDTVTFWDTTLSAAEITAQYNGGTGVEPGAPPAASAVTGVRRSRKREVPACPA